MSTIVGVDVGGTFTDLVSLDTETGATRVHKLPSTPHDQSEALLAGVLALGRPLSEIETLVHGTTVATNAVLERKGARCGLITTPGFRDLIEIRRRDRPTLYGLKGSFEPLIPRERRLEVSERTGADGEIVIPLAEAEIPALAERLQALGVEAVVISFLHAYANPANERRAGELLRARWPNEFVVLASETLPELREFERTSTAVASAYVQPLVARYLSALDTKLRAAGFRAQILVVQSNAGVMSLEVSQRFAVNTILSGPAAGVRAGARIATQAGFPDAITCDMGGTSFDVSLVISGAPALAPETTLEFGIPLRVPMVDISTIGAGGGSIAHIDRAGILQVGPESAGAQPGPVCYGRGGTRPTVTDANLVLGRINPQGAIGGDDSWQLDVEAAKQRIAEVIGEPLGLDVAHAAVAIVAVANSKMAGSIRRISIERGHDPREFVLVPFGGAGPLHVSALMRDVGIERGLIPPYPGITSALGCILADLQHDFVQTINQSLEQIDASAVAAVFAEHIARGRQLIDAGGVTVDAISTTHAADMLYQGQSHQLRVSLPGSSPTRVEIAAAFESQYGARYGALVENVAVKVMSLRSSVIGSRPAVVLPSIVAPEGSTESTPGSVRPGSVRPSSAREVYFDEGFAPCPVYQRSELAVGTTVSGPAIIEQPDATTLVDPAMQVTVDALGNLVMDAGGSPRG